jgi:hypothetical protein
MEKNELPIEERLKLNDPLIRDRTIKTIIEFPENKKGSFRSLDHMRNYLKDNNLKQGLIHLNFPVAICSSIKSIDKLYTWWDIEKKDRNMIKGVVLSNDFRNTPVYLVLFN